MSRRSEQLGLFAAFHKAGVEFAVVGGVAVNAHGFVRGTRDLDLFLRPTESNARAAFDALRAMGAPLEGLEWSDLLRDYDHIQLSSAYGRVDLLSSIGKMSFDEVWRNRVEADLDGTPVPFIGKVDLIRNKLEVGRSLDIADAEQLSLLEDRTELAFPDEQLLGD